MKKTKNISQNVDNPPVRSTLLQKDLKEMKNINQSASTINMTKKVLNPHVITNVAKNAVLTPSDKLRLSKQHHQ